MKAHNQTGYQSLKVDININIRTIKCNTCGYECMLNIQLKKHIRAKHEDRVSMPVHSCNLCGFSAKAVTKIWKHKLDNHSSDNLNKTDQRIQKPEERIQRNT